MILNFATSNIGKRKEISLILNNYNIIVNFLNTKKMEIQSNKIEKIAQFAALHIAKKKKMKIAVEDSGLHILALNGFPGPYSSYIYNTISLVGILKLIRKLPDKKAFFESVVVYASPQGLLSTFKGLTWGHISNEPKGTNGFGFDPIFVPDGSNARTFAELSLEEKNFYSHRGKALKKFGRWLVSKNT